MRAPDLSKTFTVNPPWKGWRLDVSKGPASLGSWLIEAPGIAPAWSHYLLGLCSLAHVEGMEPAKKRYDGAEYEILLCALDPDQEIDPDGGPWNVLSPVTLSLQFGGVTHLQALTILDLFAERVVQGLLSPEPNPGTTIPGAGIDKEDWRRLLQSTLACMSDGNHQEES